VESCANAIDRQAELASLQKQVEEFFDQRAHHIYRHIVLNDYSDTVQLPDDVAEGLRQARRD
jgi:predicted metal-dependent hydrolase